MTDDSNKQWAREKAAQLWCLPEFETRTMDPPFAEAIAQALLDAMERQREVDEVIARNAYSCRCDVAYTSRNRHASDCDFVVCDDIADQIKAQAIEKGGE